MYPLKSGSCLELFELHEQPLLSLLLMEKDWFGVSLLSQCTLLSVG